MPNAERYAVGVIATLEEALSIREVCDLEAQLPSRLDDMLAFEPLLGLPSMDHQKFCSRVAARVGATPSEAEVIARTVFSVMRLQVSEGEVRHIEAQLPESLRELWR